MTRQSFNDNAKPSSPIHGYHVHIYFEGGQEDSERTARQTAGLLKWMFPDDVIETARRIGAVGPHLAPNFVVEISTESRDRIVAWLQENSKGLSILVHPETNDSAKDHGESALWIGKQLDLKDGFFTKPRASSFKPR